MASTLKLAAAVDLSDAVVAFKAVAKPDPMPAAFQAAVVDLQVAEAAYLAAPDVDP